MAHQLVEPHIGDNAVALRIGIRAMVGTRRRAVDLFRANQPVVRIAVDKGVCGTAAELGVTVIVRHVHEFPGHIAYDAASESEIVVPLIRDGRVLGVLDIDSPVGGRFDHDDRIGIERLAAHFVAASDWPETA